MKASNVIRAWKDEGYRLSLSDAQRSALPPNPVGPIELTDGELGAVPAGTSLCRSISGALRSPVPPRPVFDGPSHQPGRRGNASGARFLCPARPVQPRPFPAINNNPPQHPWLRGHNRASHFQEKGPASRSHIFFSADIPVLVRGSRLSQ
jgi:mersacidin/lichenicidin family type 2 lantibiotic